MLVKHEKVKSPVLNAFSAHAGCLSVLFTAVWHDDSLAQKKDDF